MNNTMLAQAQKILDNMSDDDMAESMVQAGFHFTARDPEPKFVTFTKATVREKEFRKSIFHLCRGLLDDDEWSFRKSFTAFDGNAVSHLVVTVWTEANAAVLKLTVQPDVKVAVSDDEPMFA